MSSNSRRFSFPLLFIYGRQFHVFIDIYYFYALAKLVCQTYKQTTHMSAQWHKCFHTMLFLILLTCWPGPVRPATECWSSTVRTQTSEAAARSRSAVLITRRARPGVASLGLSRGETVTRQRLAMIHPRENNNRNNAASGLWWGHLHSRYTRHGHNTLHPSSSLLTVWNVQ